LYVCIHVRGVRRHVWESDPGVRGNGWGGAGGRRGLVWRGKDPRSMFAMEH